MPAAAAPRVSVIIPTYNCDRYITQAVESALSQTYRNREIIVVDDGSTDDTLRVLEPYFEQIRYVYQENQGVAVARNSGIEIAQGELIAFLDGDDFFLPDKLARQVACFEAEPSLGMVISGWRLVNQKGEAISDVKLWRHAPKLDLKTVVLYKPARPSATMVRREWCERVKGFDNRLSSAEDLDFLLRLMLMDCKVAWFPEVQVCYRQHSSSLMSRGIALIKDTETVMEQFFARQDLPESIRQLKNRERYQSLVWLACRMYFDRYPAEMAECLQKSLHYTPFSLTQTAFNWIRDFKNYASEYSHNFDVYSLINSAAWQQATHSISPTPKIAVPKTNVVTTAKNHLLLYTDDLGIGGVRQCNHAIVCHFATSGYQVSHVHYRDFSPLSRREQELGIQQVNLDYHAGKDLTRTLKDLKGAQKIFAQTQPALIVFSDGWPFSNLAAKKAAIQMGIPYIIVLGFIEPSCVHYSYQDGVPYADLVNYQYSQARAVIAVSQENLNLLRQLFKLPVTIGQVIYNGRPSQYFSSPVPSVRQRLRQELEIPLDSVVCFTAARMEPIKGYQYQLEAIRQLKESRIWSWLYFVWAGTGAESFDNSNEEELKETVRLLGVTEQVKFLGQRWDIPDWLDASDIFILPSEAEGMPLAVMEAMAKGLPVVASAVSGIPEELGDTGKLLPNPKIDAQATIKELVSTIEAWASSLELCQAVGQACRKRAEELFREETMLNQYMEVIEQVLSQGENSTEQYLSQKESEKISQMKERFQYSSLVWDAWHKYCQGDTAAMTSSLEKSLQLTPYALTKTIFDWVKSFSRFSLEKGSNFDAYSLINLSKLVIPKLKSRERI